MTCPECGLDHPPTQEDLVTFSEGVDHARELFAEAYVKITGREPTRAQLAEYGAEDDADIARMKAELGSASKAEVEKIVEFSNTSTGEENVMSDRDKSRAQTHHWMKANGGFESTAEFSEAAPALTGNRERDETRLWAHRQNLAERPAPKPEGGPRGFLMPLPMLRDPLQPLPDPDRSGDITPAALEHARAVAGDRLVEIALVAIASTPPAAAVVHYGGGLIPAFDRVQTEDRVRRAVVLQMIADGATTIALAEVDRIAGARVVKMWADHAAGGRGLSGPAILGEMLASGEMFRGWATRRISIEEDALARLDRSLVTLGLGLDRYSREASPVLERLVDLRRKLAALDASLGAIKAAVTSSISGAIEAAGGAARLVVAIREAMQKQGAYPGPDYQLDDLHKQHDAAVAELGKFGTLDANEPEGDLQRAAREKCDELRPRMIARRAEVERLAKDRIIALVVEASEGDLSALATIANHVQAAPGAVADDVRKALDRMLPDATQHASGLMPCL